MLSHRFAATNMKATMEILSEEIIKPSSPTSHDHRKMKLSYLDQVLPPMYFPIMFFYEASDSSSLSCSNHSQISNQLKQSLSNTLTSFYPLAGTLIHSSIIDCNDVGAEFIEARIDAHLADALQQYNMDDLDRYLPLCPANGKDNLLIVKVTFFKCGGISIGIRVSHELADCGSLMAFVNAWAATCRGKTHFLQSNFNLANYFPTRDLPDVEFLPIADENFITKRFVFNEEALIILKRGATSPMVKDPTRVEAVSAFIWMHIIEMAKSKTSEAGSISPAFHAVNLRPRTSQPHSLENVFGNCIMLSLAFYNANCSPVSNQFQDLVSKLRSAIRKIDEDYITKAQNGDSYLDDLRKVSSMQMKGELMEGCICTSWCGFPIYEVDYGWGNPTWACSTGSLGLKNFILLMNTKCGKGIEAWVCMDEDTLESLATKIKLIPTTTTF